MFLVLSISLWLWVCSFAMFPITISDPRLIRLWCVKGTAESMLDKDQAVPLMHHDPSDLGSLIPTWTISKECTLCFSLPFFKSNLSNLGCDLSMSAAYTQVFTAHYMYYRRKEKKILTTSYCFMIHNVWAAIMKNIIYIVWILKCHKSKAPFKWTKNINFNH